MSNQTQQSWSTGCAFTPDQQLNLPTFSTAAKVRVAITFLLCTVSGICNLAVLCSAYDSRHKSHVRLLMLNLSVADLMMAFIVMPLEAAWNITVQWHAGDFPCRVLMFLRLMAMYSCAFVTVVISLDRQRAILNPLAIHQARKTNKIQLTVAWMLSVILSLPHAFLFHQVTITSPERFTQCATHGSFSYCWQETLYHMFNFCCLFLLPLVIMVSCYMRILIEISRGVMGERASSNQIHLRRSNNKIIPKARLRTLKMTIIIVSSFIVCWMPYYVLGLWYWFSPQTMRKAVSDSLTHLLYLFGLLNACVDPLIYGLFTLPLYRQQRKHRRQVTLDRRSTTQVMSLSIRQLHSTGTLEGQLEQEGCLKMRQREDGENPANCSELFM